MERPWTGIENPFFGGGGMNGKQIKVEPSEAFCGLTTDKLLV